MITPAVFPSLLRKGEKAVVEGGWVKIENGEDKLCIKLCNADLLKDIRRECRKIDHYYIDNYSGETICIPESGYEESVEVYDCTKTAVFILEEENRVIIRREEHTPICIRRGLKRKK